MPSLASTRTFVSPTSSLDKSVAMSASQSNGTNGAASEPQRSHEAAEQRAKDMPKDPLATQKSSTKQGVTFAAQDMLPKLPIPDLEATTKRYLEALEPLQTGREHRDSEIAVQDFLRGQGPELQERLKQYSAGKSSYIEQFCKPSRAVLKRTIC